MLFLLFQSKFLINLDDPYIMSSLTMHLQNRTKQRRHSLKKDYWDKVEDKTKILQTCQRGEKIDNREWKALVASWATTKK